MAAASVWFTGADMRVQYSGLISSTAATSTGYIANSTGVGCDVWSTISTAVVGNRLVNNRNMPYVAGSTGNYRVIIQSTDFSGMSTGQIGMVVIRVAHSALTDKRYQPFRVEKRALT